LSWAAEDSHVDVVKFLVKEAGADLESKAKSGKTPLSCAAYNGRLEVVKFLVNEAGADVESKDNDGRTPLDVATQERWRGEECKAVAAWLEEKERGTTMANVNERC